MKINHNFVVGKEYRLISHKTSLCVKIIPKYIGDCLLVSDYHFKDGTSREDVVSLSAAVIYYEELPPEPVIEERWINFFRTTGYSSKEEAISCMYDPKCLGMIKVTLRDGKPDKVELVDVKEDKK